MIHFLLPFLIFQNKMVFFDFSSNSNLSEWMVVDDVVMGGRSDGALYINEAGHAVFQGTVSLENNGGFSSIRHRFPSKKVEGNNKVLIKLKGDGKRYQFRVKANQYDRHSYISYFQTTGEWQTIEILLADLYPTFRGRRLSMSNFPSQTIAEIAFLIGNKKDESFKLEVDFIYLEKLKF